MSGIAITTSTNTLKLDTDKAGNLVGSISFTVTNTSSRNLTFRARGEVDANAKLDWFTITNPDRPAPVDSTHQFDVAVSIPRGTPPGLYQFRLNVVGVENPDEYAAEGQWISVDVPATDAPPPPSRLWMLLVACGAVLVIAIVVGVVALTHRGATPSPTPAPSLARSPSAVATPAILCSGSSTLRGTFIFDFESCREASPGDVWWDQIDSVHRVLLPQPGASIAPLGHVAFETVTLAQLKSAPYSMSGINGSNDAQNQLVPGTVIAVRTRSGRYAKMRVDGYGYNLAITYVTYV